MPEHVPFRAAVAAVCGLDNTTRDVAEEFVAVEEEQQAMSLSTTATAPWVGGWNGGQWLIPEIQTDASGLACDPSRFQDAAYILNATAALAAYNGGRTFNTSATFFTVCSMGSAMAIWSAQCAHALEPSAVSAFASQSTGLKTKGDGLTFPPDNYQPQYSWGECPQCEYFPAPVVQTRGLKACIVDQYGDRDFYYSSLALNRTWRAAGMRAEVDLHPGSHCQTRSFEWIVECIDDGTGRLLR